MSVDPQFIRVGMEVVGRDGELAGTVKNVGSDWFHLDRPFARDLVVPIDAVQAIVDSTASDSINPHVVLGVRADSVGSMGWRHPE